MEKQPSKQHPFWRPLRKPTYPQDLERPPYAGAPIVYSYKGSDMPPGKKDYVVISIPFATR